MTDQDKILLFLRTSGPTIPAKVAKHISTEILLASAHLSDLSSQGKVKISGLKIGGTPLYYLPGQEGQLYPFAAGNINPKDLQVLETLKTKQVLREKELDLLSKVALRSLKDFAVPLHVTIQSQTEIFWKWSLLSDEQTNVRIKELLQPEASQEPVELPTPQHAPMPLETQKILLDKKYQELDQELETEEVEEKSEKPFLQKIKERIKKPKVEDDFLPALEQFFNKLKIKVEQKETVRKTELNFIVKIPSVVGTMTYFCKAKNKTRCDERDVSSAYMEAQVKKLPLLFLYNNELNKKAQEMLDSGAFENLLVKRIE